MASKGFQYRVLFQYGRDGGDDLSVQTGDLLTVAKALAVAAVTEPRKSGTFLVPLWKLLCPIKRERPQPRLRPDRCLRLQVSFLRVTFSEGT